MTIYRPLLMTQKDKFYTVQLALSRFRSESGNEWQYTMAATAVIILPIIILLFLQKYFIEGIATTGLEGVNGNRMKRELHYY